MPERIQFSKRGSRIVEVAKRKSDVDAALRLYFSGVNPSFMDRFLGYTAEDILQELQERLDEIDKALSLVIFGILEAAFQIDFEQRCRLRKKDPLSRELRRLLLQTRSKNTRIAFVNDILELWKKHMPDLSQEISEIKASFRFRNWLAHGRYWEPKFGRAYDFDTVYRMTYRVLTSFPLEGGG